MHLDLDKELRLARSAAARAGELALRHQAAGLKAEAKDDSSPVTIADRECERLISSMLDEAFPADGILGEEGARKESSSGRRWIVDPIDGTRDFFRGNPSWAVLIGLEVNGEVRAGVSYMPAMSEMYFALKGAGAYCNDSPVRVSSVARPEEAVLCVNSLNGLLEQPFGSRFMEWAARFWSVRSMGGCLDAMMIAQGQADAWIEPTAKPWDLAPLKIIIEEAGGRFFNFDGGSSIHGGNCIACTPALEAELFRFVTLAEAA